MQPPKPELEEAIKLTTQYQAGIFKDEVEVEYPRPAKVDERENVKDNVLPLRKPEPDYWLP